MTTYPLALPASRPVAFGPQPDAPALPLLHPLVRAALRADELAAIETRVRLHGVTRCPTRFVAPSRHAALEQDEPIERQPSDTPLTTAADCARWLRDHGHPGFSLVRPGLFHRLGHLLTADALVRSVCRLQARRLRRADDTTDATRSPPSRRDCDAPRLPRTGAAVDGPAAAPPAAGLSFR